MGKKLALGKMLVAILAMQIPGPANAVTSGGWRELAMHVPDITLKPGVSAYRVIELKTIELDNTMPTDSGAGLVPTRGRQRHLAPLYLPRV